MLTSNVAECDTPPSLNSLSTSPSSSTTCTKRDPPSPTCKTPKRPRVTPQQQSFPTFHNVSTSASSIISTTRPRRATPAAELPDEVLVHIFRFIHKASRLANLRLVCRQWRRVIDTTPPVWRSVSFKNSSFTPPVQTQNKRLCLGERPGRRAVTLAARSGNEWARFLKSVIFERQPLRAVTIPQPRASELVSGLTTTIARPFKGDDGWLAIHSARGGEDVKGLPKGAVVGIVHVGGGRVDRAVVLKKPIRCAGFVGVWKVSGVLTDLLVAALHRQ